MAITVINLESAIVAFDELCNHYLEDTDVDELASSIVAKQFDAPLDEALDEWLHVSQDDLDTNYMTLKEKAEDTPVLLALNDLLYEIHESFGHLGLIIRVVILDKLGNMLVQTEDIDNGSYRFHINSKDRVVQYPRHSYFRH